MPHIIRTFGGNGNSLPKLKSGMRVIYTDYDNKRHKGTLGGPDKKNGKTIWDVDLDSGDGAWGYPEQFKILNESVIKESLDLYDIAQELDNNDILPGFAGMEGEGDILRVDFDGGNQSIWLYPDGSVDGNVSPRAIQFLQSKGFKFTKNESKNLKGIKNVLSLLEASVLKEGQDEGTIIQRQGELDSANNKKYVEPHCKAFIAFFKDILRPKKISAKNIAGHINLIFEGVTCPETQGFANPVEWKTFFKQKNLGEARYIFTVKLLQPQTVQIEFMTFKQLKTCFWFSTGAPVKLKEAPEFDLMSSLIGMGYGKPQPKSPTLKPGDRVIYTDYDNKKWKGTIGGKDRKKGNVVYDVDLDNGEGAWGYENQFKKLIESSARNEIKNILSLLEEEVNKEEKLPLNESKFGRVLGEFQNYVSKVVSALIRNNVPDSKDLNLALITQCFSNGMNSRDCAQTYINSLNSNKEE